MVREIVRKPKADLSSSRNMKDRWLKASSAKRITQQKVQAMEYFTLLTVYYEFLDYPMEFSVWFYNQNDCWDAVIEKVSIYKLIDAEQATCQESDIISKAVKPKVRPW